jgi:dTDP-4-dehydrorhamnose reductase
MKISILGVSGMLGSQLLKSMSKHGLDIIATYRSADKINADAYPDVQFVQLDVSSASITDIQKTIAGSTWCINCIGIIKPYIKDTDMDDVLCAIDVNSAFPARLAAAAKKTGTKVMQIATDCVWDGQAGTYRENAPHNAGDVYGKSKSLGEIQAENFFNLRCSIIGKELDGHVSLMDWFLAQPHGAEINGYTNHHWNGITTLQFSNICAAIIKHGYTPRNLQHIVPANSLNKNDLLHIFADVFERKDIKIMPYDAPIGIDRTIQTLFTSENKELWSLAGYETPPTLQAMIQEFKESL